MTTDPSGYARHTIWSDPGRHAEAIARLSPDPSTLVGKIANLVLHPTFAAARGVDPATNGIADSDVRRIPDVVDILLDRDSRPLDVPRAPAARLLGSCRTYALMAASVLRRHGTPARLRVGFANYFSTTFNVDHWVCEYWSDAGWRLLDAELDEDTRGPLGLDFPSHDVPRSRFVVAAEAWTAIRSGQADPDRFGVPYTSRLIE